MRQTLASFGRSHLTLREVDLVEWYRQRREDSHILNFCTRIHLLQDIGRARLIGYLSRNARRQSEAA